MNEMRTCRARKPSKLRIDTCVCGSCGKEKPVNAGNWQVDTRNLRNGGFRLGKCLRCLRVDSRRRRAERAIRKATGESVSLVEAKERLSALRETIGYHCMKNWKGHCKRPGEYVEHNAGVFNDMLERQGGRCPLTGDVLTKQNVSIDHIVPVSSGGGHEVANLRLVTKDVNRARLNMSDADFIELCRKVVRTFT